MTDTDTYDPYDSLVDIHNLPHLDEDLTRTSNDFDPSLEYAISIILLPVIILFIAAVLYQLPLLFYQVYRLVKVQELS
jgi:hypothetical protein